MIPSEIKILLLIFILKDVFFNITSFKKIKEKKILFLIKTKPMLFFTM
ncbi:hypothetical protein MEJ65_00585 [Candidatus Carsonella ruddii]|uniref:Uncharacterized protein n=1 Tax=Carsonella ruddii TaxID=114186 RepID=A0AAJ6FGH1_CARRU|nr:hypothetical protein [Candidatus Carsonella ruddii]WGS67155.1 hypothetical protein MEJ65_00585 [Candidatus Carsonella ruddii]